MQTQAALVAAFVSILVFILGEIFKRRLKKQDKRDEVKKVFKRYADPLASASTALLWRLQEVFDPGGKGFYLGGLHHKTKYENYKAMSTLYRLACVLGWIQAIRRELVFVHESRSRKVVNIEAALRKFASAFAEGGHIETTRVQSLVKLWDISPGSVREDAIKQTGVRLDYLVKRELHEYHASSLPELTAEQSVEIRNAVAVELCQGLGVPKISDGVLIETHARAMQYLNVREAWIYRDWQAAIGDVMLRPASTGTVRVHEVIGYKEFELICNSGGDEDREWLRRLYSVIEDLDSLGDTRRDARIQQLADIRAATGEIVRSLHEADNKNVMISRESLNEAKVARAKTG